MWYINKFESYIEKKKTCISRFTLSLPLSLSKTLLTCNECDDVPFSCSNDVILYLVEELVIKSSLWNHRISYAALLCICKSNQADVPSRNTKLLLLNSSICKISETQEKKFNWDIQFLVNPGDSYPGAN